MKLFFSLLVTLVLTSSLYAQIGIGTTTPDPSSSLDISSVSTGVLLPRLTEFQRDAIVNPAVGLWICCSNCGPNGEMQVFNGGMWTNMIGDPAAAVPPPNIGDDYQGGTVFYIFQQGDDGYVAGEVHGLIAATSDADATLQWSLDNYSLVTGVTDEAIGKGKTNTASLISILGQDAKAANYCDDYSIEVDGVKIFDDWFLPSKIELKKMYQNIGQGNPLDSGNIGNFENSTYWSSTEQLNTQYSYIIDFTDGDDSTSGFKGTTHKVRPVRSF